jgi:preprotein translocase subunit SecF
MFSFAQFGNDLYTGRRAYDIVGRRRTWYAIAAAVIVLSVLLLLLRGLNPGIEFRGGSEFRVSDVASTDVALAERTVTEVVADAAVPRATAIGDDTVRVQTEQLSDEETDAVAGALAEAFEVDRGAVTSSFVGPSWGADVSGAALQALVIFLILVGIVISLYFRTWKMAVAALVALLHDLVITAGIYAAIGFEVTPATVIGFLTILGYSLYDTVVVFDKVRENTEHVLAGSRRTYAEEANRAVNQTLVRSVNTSVVATLPVAAILFIGALLLGAGTLRDISLALFIGIIAGTYSSIFLATPLLVHLREREPAIGEHTARVLSRRGAGTGEPAPAAAGAGTTAGTTAGGTATAVTERPAEAPERATRPAAGEQRAQPRRRRPGRPSGKRR